MGFRVLIIFFSLLATSSQNILGQKTVKTGPNVWVSQSMKELVHAEATIAVDQKNPNRMLVAAIVLRKPLDESWMDNQTIYAYLSEDGGNTWVKQKIGALSEDWTAGDPWLIWTPKGNIFLSALSGEGFTRKSNHPIRARVYYAEAFGKQWSLLDKELFEPWSSEDHPVLTPIVESSNDSILYLVASHATGEAEGIDVAKINSRNLEISWVSPFRPDIEQVNLGGAGLLSDNKLIISFFSMSTPRNLWSVKFDPKLNSWSKISLIQENILPVGFPPLVVDRTKSTFAGRIYSVWVERSDESNTNVLLSSSNDDGNTWTAPKIVHTVELKSFKTLPAISISSSGLVGIIWQDQRHSTTEKKCFDLYGTISMDGGKTFLPESRISSQTACMGTYEENGAAISRFQLGGGDYQSLIASESSAFQAVWCDSRSGKFQIWTAKMSVD